MLLSFTLCNVPEFRYLLASSVWSRGVPWPWLGPVGAQIDPFMGRLGAAVAPNTALQRIQGVVC